MIIPSPQEIGLPEKFASWRPKQIEALKVLRESHERATRIIAIEGPTGSGKSAVYTAEAILSELPTAVVTASRGLEDQLSHPEYGDFTPCGMVDLRGRRNYTCAMKPDYTCEEGRATRCPYNGTHLCQCSQAEMRAAISMLVSTNYDKWTSAKKYGQGMNHFQQVIFDEAHTCPEALARAMQQLLHPREIQESLKMLPLEGDEAEDMAEWKDWAAGARAVAENALAAALAKISCSEPKPTWVREYLHVRNLCRRLAILANCRASNWVVDQTKDGYFQFDPIRPGIYAESALLLRVPRIILLSATLRPKTLYMLGLGKDAFEFHEFTSDFPVDRCPIYYLPVMRVDKNADNLSALWTVLEQFMARRRDRKGIIHTVSYARAKELVARSRFSSSMILDKPGVSSSEAVKKFKASGPGTILVSPAVSEGYDFPGIECEWQFLCKVPFPDGRAKIIKARQADDKEYGPYKAAQDMDQAAGRGMRSATDQCETIICDMHFGDWFFNRYRHLFSKNFRSRLRQVAVLPAPPRTLYET